MSFWIGLLLGVHIVGASIWVGGSIALGVVVGVLRGDRAIDPPGYSRRVGRVARTLTWLLWPALILTIATGLANLSWYLPPGAGLLTSPGGLWLPAKLVTVGIVVVTNGLHTFLLGPRARKAAELGLPPNSVRRLQVWSAGFASASMVASVAVLLEAAMLGGL